MRLLSVAAFATCVATTIPCAAQTPSKEECLDAYRDNQRLRRDGKLKEARAKLLICARDPCSSVLQKDCVEWLRDIEANQPSLTFGAVDEKGDVEDVKVSMDGSPIATRLDGRAIEVDPGPHHFVLEHGGMTVERDLVVREGERGRRLDVRFERTPSHASVEPRAALVVTRRPVTWPTVVFAVAGVAGLAVAGSFGALGLVQRSNLDDCKPNCGEDRLSPVRTSFLVADVTGGVSLAALVVATVLFVTRPTTRAPIAVAPNGATLLLRF